MSKPNDNEPRPQPEELSINQAHDNASMAEADVRVEARLAAWQAERDAAYTTLVQRAKAVSAASVGWGAVQSQEQWQELYEQAQEARRSGSFLLQRLGAERFLYPTFMAVLLGQRQGLIEEYQVHGVAE